MEKIGRRSTIRPLLLVVMLGGLLGLGGVWAQGSRWTTIEDDSEWTTLKRSLSWTTVPCDLQGSSVPPEQIAEFLRNHVGVAIAERGPAMAFSWAPDAASAAGIGSFAFGIDGLDRSGRPVTAETPPGLRRGATFGMGINVVTRSGANQWRGSAIYAPDDGGDLQLAGRASVWTDEVSGRTVIEFPLDTFPAGIDKVRVTAVLNESYCAVLGDPMVDDGYVPTASFDPEVQRILDAINGTYQCHAAANTCVLLPGDVAATPTGDGMLDVAFQGLNFGVQFSASGGHPDDILASFQGAGWTLANPVEVDTGFLDWRRFDLGVGEQSMGALGVSDNGSSNNPAAFAVSVISPAALTAEQLEVARELVALLAKGFNSVFEAF